jgi:O-antigen/teichoic acid export membrane protein
VSASPSTNPVTRLRKNLIANFAGQGAATLIQLAVTPVYVWYLGIEAYGLIGFQITLQALSQALDLGVSSTVNRELARHSALTRNADESRDFVRTLEAGYWLVGIGIGLAIYLAAPYLSSHWLQRSTLPVTVVKQSVRIMAILVAVQWPLTFYQGGLLGLQQHWSLNSARIATTAVAAAGGYILVARISPTITAFLWWQSAVNLVHVGLVAGLLWHGLPASTRTPRIRINAVRHTYRFAAGITVITAAMLALTQLDRIVLSRLVSLDEFGYFVVAALVGYGLTALARPVFTATYPRFSALAASHDAPGLKHVYRRAWQLMMTLVVPAAAVVAAFSSDLLFVWTHSRTVANVAGPIAAFLVVGTALNALMYVPYALQLAYGWTRLTAQVSVVLILIATPAIVLATSRYGTLGASTIWPAVNVVYMLVALPITHRRLLPDTGLDWFLREVAGPVAASILATILCRLAMPVANDPGWIVMEVAVAWTAAEIALILSNTDLRGRLKGSVFTIVHFARRKSFQVGA